ncbi:hypothetical protein BCR34DRAFT_364148 [Clohesyomyces aquaticus]|uniref:Uncharacterized protein n=1 Tax=Clohesyomyces aquaticus TaxID=1231657 RepID=A0A1Y1ZHZ3_9PLEO|nr:hypothetical protein BCR34DRAFT_364148 [Clohesyomyces aquaticus]
MPSPYIEYDSHARSTLHDASSNSDISRFQEFSRLELPRLVRRTLEVVVEQEAQPLEDKLKERLVDIVKECQTQLMTMFQVHGNDGENTSTITEEKTVESDHETAPPPVEYSPPPSHPELGSPPQFPSRQTQNPQLQPQPQPHSHSNTDQSLAFPWQDTDAYPYAAPLFSLPSTSSDSVDVSLTSHTPSTSISAYTSNKHPTSSPPSQEISSPDSGYDSTCTWTNPWPKDINMAMSSFEFGFFGDGEQGGDMGFQDFAKFVGTEGDAYGGECEGGGGSQDVDLNWMGKHGWMEEGR